jgi:hypothetical protein
MRQEHRAQPTRPGTVAPSSSTSRAAWELRRRTRTGPSARIITPAESTSSSTRRQRLRDGNTPLVKRPKRLQALGSRLVHAVWRWQRQVARRLGVQGPLRGGAVVFTRVVRLKASSDASPPRASPFSRCGRNTARWWSSPPPTTPTPSSDASCARQKRRTSPTKMPRGLWTSTRRSSTRPSSTHCAWTHHRALADAAAPWPWLLPSRRHRRPRQRQGRPRAPRSAQGGPSPSPGIAASTTAATGTRQGAASPSPSRPLPSSVTSSR